jgi:uncharacterized radical SAM superfamily protein
MISRIVYCQHCVCTWVIAIIKNDVYDNLSTHFMLLKKGASYKLLTKDLYSNVSLYQWEYMNSLVYKTNYNSIFIWTYALWNAANSVTILYKGLVCVDCVQKIIFAVIPW